MSIRIRCINKSNGDHENPHESVNHYGWINENNNETGKNDRPSMVQWMEKGNKAYVVGKEKEKVYCYVNKSRYGTKFLQTAADGKFTNNLLELPECR